eukprot:jgi/Botrbrau1/13876/Bobra.0056s0108.1
MSRAILLLIGITASQASIPTLKRVSDIIAAHAKLDLNTKDSVEAVSAVHGGSTRESGAGTPNIHGSVSDTITISLDQPPALPDVAAAAAESAVAGLPATVPDAGPPSVEQLPVMPDVPGPVPEAVPPSFPANIPDGSPLSFKQQQAPASVSAPAPAAIESLARTSQSLPDLPILYTIGKSWLLFGLQAIGGVNPPDFLPDPAVRFLNQGPASLAITRYADGPFGPWDQAAFTPGFANLINTSVSTSRSTQVYTSSPLAAQLDFPTHVFSKVARFEWSTRPDGLEDLNIYAPPTASTPSAWVKGLWSIPFLAIPVPNTTYYIPTNLFDELVSVISNFEPNGTPNITGHRLTHFDIQGTTSIGGFLSYGAVEGGLSQGGILPVGLHLNDGTKFSVGSRPIPTS